MRLSSASSSEVTRASQAGEDQVGHVAARIGGDVDEVLPVGARRAACKVQIERRGGGAYARYLAERKRC